ncbi:hypothetical protein AA0113_g5872 [Alternaria arborescens]|uniref:Uncharacterized protein n=1 Tax=Alternaria arborescens TaxID=156630 RepID=A0A4Q4S517_9PLEO|nr:hypothetical protein AA0113_g5872 [Alternaria arborescens]
MSKEVFFEGDAEVLPFTTPTTPTTTLQKPSDILDVPAAVPSTIWYLSITKPHVDSHDIVGPTKAFRHLLPRIEAVVSNSPTAIDKLAQLKETEDMWGETEPNEHFFNNGFEVFIVEGQRGSYTVLKMIREINKEVFDILPAPVYTVLSVGPLEHAAIPLKAKSSSSSSSSSSSAPASASKSSSVPLSSKFSPGKPKGYAATTQLHGSFIERAAARETAKYIMTVLLLDEENVKEIGRWEMGSKGGGVLMAMNATSMWEVKVVYADDPIGRAQEEADRGADAFVS